MDILERLEAEAQARPRRIVFPETDDPRIRETMAELERRGLCQPVPLAPQSDAQRAALIDGRGVKPALADRMLSKPLIRAAAMVAAGEADAMIAGVTNPTRRVIEAAGLGIGLAEGIAQPSSFFLMRFPGGRDMIWSDCAVTVDPDAAALTGIAQASARSARALLGDARVALLSFSTGTSGTGDSVDKVRAAAEATGFNGPVQADAALNAGIAAKKGVPFDDPNVLIFPSLDAANISYKLAQELAGAQALGPFLQGFRRPVCDLSRGASVDDIVKSTVVISALA
ncbi:phosphate acetyltransferase [Loktanella sp. IMCC34160]|uniref:phosphate acyltransferase n=1 Tax=Loktanella sp. IMCC34160 TaxID=2510646 RepID=UPI00101D6453|nr:phosphate acyltransferase [Loktanella sp. IMCC34160]RYG92677.1 phosphate acetyltransferase [Loktanella sp. IMCC34160]